MKYGILYQTYNDIAPILYCLQPFKYEKIENYKFKFFVGSDEFLFSRQYKDLFQCDKKILACITDWNKESHHKFHKTICSFPGEAVPNNINDEMLIEFMDKGNICITSCNTGLTHKNLMFDYMFNLVYLYYLQGYNYVNIKDFKNEKTNLLGLYDTSAHISGNVIQPRVAIYNELKNILNQDLYVYPKKVNNLTSILEPYNYMGLWERNFASTYTDFITSACSVIFETNSFRINEPILREHSTEKTLKCIIFSEANIFTLWYGSMHQYNELKKRGFWFLNFEFIHNEELTLMDITNSIYSAAEYLKKLKTELITDTKVHEHLVEKFGDKLKKNVDIFTDILDNCQYTNQLLENIKS